MKFTILICCLLTITLLDCNKATTEKTVESERAAAISEKQPEMEANNQDRQGDIEYEIKTRLVKKGLRDGINYTEDTLYIDYVVKNTGNKNYLLFNQGHTDRDDRNAVYVEPQPDGSLELSQKAFALPKDKSCPRYDAPILPRATLLKPKQTIKGQLKTALTLKLNTPFAACSPQPAMPIEIKRARFCLGFAEADTSKVKVDASGNVQGWSAFNEQKLLCREINFLK